MRCLLGFTNSDTDTVPHATRGIEIVVINQFCLDRVGCSLSYELVKGVINRVIQGVIQGSF